MRILLLATVGLIALTTTTMAADLRAQPPAANPVAGKGITEICGPGFLRAQPSGAKAYRIGGRISGNTFTFRLPPEKEVTAPAPQDDFAEFGFGIAAQQGSLVAVVLGNRVTVYGAPPADFANNGVPPEEGCTAYTQTRI
jgi:hypothetical protein